MTQSELAKLSGVGHGYISRIEIGMQEPTLGIIEKLAAALKVEPAALLEYGEHTRPKKSKK